MQGQTKGGRRFTTPMTQRLRDKLTWAVQSCQNSEQTILGATRQNRAPYSIDAIHRQLAGQAEGWHNRRVDISRSPPHHGQGFVHGYTRHPKGAATLEPRASRTTLWYIGERRRATHRRRNRRSHPKGGNMQGRATNSYPTFEILDQARALADYMIGAQHNPGVEATMEDERAISAALKELVRARMAERGSNASNPNSLPSHRSLRADGPPEPGQPGPGGQPRGMAGRLRHRNRQGPGRG